MSVATIISSPSTDRSVLPTFPPMSFSNEVNGSASVPQEPMMGQSLTHKQWDQDTNDLALALQAAVKNILLNDADPSVFQQAVLKAFREEAENFPSSYALETSITDNTKERYTGLQSQGFSPFQTPQAQTPPSSAPYFTSATSCLPLSLSDASNLTPSALTSGGVSRTSSLGGNPLDDAVEKITNEDQKLAGDHGEATTPSPSSRVRTFPLVVHSAPPNAQHPYARNIHVLPLPDDSAKPTMSTAPTTPNLTVTPIGDTNMADQIDQWSAGIQGPFSGGNTPPSGPIRSPNILPTTTSTPSTPAATKPAIIPLSSFSTYQFQQLGKVVGLPVPTNTSPSSASPTAPLTPPVVAIKLPTKAPKPTLRSRADINSLLVTHQLLHPQSPIFNFADSILKNHPKAVPHSLIEAIIYVLSIDPIMLTKHLMGWLVLKHLWNISPTDFDASALNVLRSKSLKLQDSILLLMASLDLSDIANLSAFLISLIKEHDKARHTCIHFLIGLCECEDLQCELVHPTNTPGWIVLRERWGVSYADMDYAVLNNLAKRPYEERETILAMISAMSLKTITNMSAFISAAIRKFDLYGSTRSLTEYKLDCDRLFPKNPQSRPAFNNNNNSNSLFTQNTVTAPAYGRQSRGRK